MLMVIVLFTSLVFTACLADNPGTPSPGGGGVSPAPGPTGTPEPITLTPDQNRELVRLMRWQKDIMRYYDSILSFTSCFNQAQALKAGTAGSLLQARPYVDEMKSIIERVQGIVPDDDMRAGHMKLLSAFNLMLQSLVLVPGSPGIFGQSQRDLAIAQAELMKWRAHYEAAEKRFVQSTGQDR